MKKYLYIIFTSLFLVFATYGSVYATSEFNSPLTSDEESELSKYDSLVKMISDIFGFDSDKGSKLLSNTEELLFALVNTMIVRIEEISETRLYRYIQATALLFLMINFFIGYYEENSTGYEKSYLSKILISQYMKLIFAFIFILMIKNFAIFFMSFFRFLLSISLDIKNNLELGEIPNIKNIINTDRIAYNILSEAGLVKNTSAIEEVAIRSKEASIRSMYMLPWILCWVGKVGEIVVVFFNSIMLLVYSLFYPMAMTDIINDFKHSRFLNYTRNLISFAVQEVIIITIIYIGEMILNYFIREVLNGVIDGTSKTAYLTIAIIITSLSITKFILMIGSFALSRKIMGVG